ncbi:MAG: hypothetical protein Q9195_005729 [Heterodermia aff. obscurata]
MISLSWTPETLGFICRLFGADSNSHLSHSLARLTAIAWIWALNIALQPVQAGSRALIVDNTPASQQAQASAFASFAVIVGSAFGYGWGFVNLPSKAAWLVDGQFKGLCLAASGALAVTMTITCTMMDDSPAAEILDDHTGRPGVRHVYLEIYKKMTKLSRKSKQVCIVQFFSWLAWFPFLYYITTYLSKLCKPPLPFSTQTTSNAKTDEAQLLWTAMGPPSTRFYNALHRHSIQHGLLAMLLFALVALHANILLPYLIPPTRTSTPTSKSTTESARESPARSPLTLPRAWTYAHILTALCLLGSTASSSFLAATSCVALLGIPWALTQWAPYAILGAEIASPPPPSPTRVSHADGEKSQAGTVMGVHNMAIAVPQIVSALLSSGIFALFRAVGLGDGEAVRWVLRVGVLAAVGAGWVAGGIE